MYYRPLDPFQRKGMFVTLHRDLPSEPLISESQTEKTKRIFANVKFKTERNVIDENKWLSHPLIPGEIEIRRAFMQRGANSLSLYDFAVFSYLFIMSRRRLFVRGDDATFAESLNEPRKKITATINKLSNLHYVRRLIHKGTPGFIVNPDLINNGDVQRQAFKVRLWGNSFVSPVIEKPKRESCYPLKRKKRIQSNNEGDS